MKASPRVLVIGGMNADVLATCEGEYREGDSVPGRLALRPGGVGRNVAAALAAHGARVELLTALGTDGNSNTLRASCAALGIGLSLSLTVPGPSPAYVAIHSRDGRMRAAVNDMAALEAITPECLEGMAGELSSFDACVLDANLREDTLVKAAHILRCPLVADPVSAAKAPRLSRILPRLHAVKPNLLEALAMTGREDAEGAAARLLGMGVRRVFISLGPEGVYWADGTTQGRVPVHAVLTASETGAGDAMTAGIAWGAAIGLSTVETACL
ncbi:MAG TPA: PfkB family carbohydrate kinase, partial [Candidatus Limnocylindria bacterium]|nr:PfkB family carbohydrate kinase [Candidatus Limnocylindria bacterium]